MNKPFFSVIVPAHNAEAFLAKGLETIKSQEFKDYELIVVCDNCSDKTAEIARQFTDKVIETDYGLDGLARNAGLDAAGGDWVLWMDHDDWWLHEYAFQMLHDFIMVRKNEPLDVVLFNFIWKGKGYAMQIRRRTVAVWNKCWRREFIGDTRFPDTPYWSDVKFNEDMFDKNPICTTLPHALYYYNYLMEGSISWRAEQGEIEKWRDDSDG